MKEFIEKLIGRLEERKAEHLHDEKVMQELEKNNLATFCSAKARALDGAIEIVNQLAEEYKGKYLSKDEVGYMLDTIEMRGDESWMDYYRKALKGLCELSGEEYNNGWIPISERLPKSGSAVLVLLKDEGDGITMDCGKTCDIAWLSGSGFFTSPQEKYSCEDVIAWQPLPAPFQPKGE